MLFVTETTDEDGKTIREFTDMEGKIIQKEMNGAKTTPEWTYIIYDSLNRPTEQGTWATATSRTTLTTSINGSITYMSGQASRSALKYFYYDVYSSVPSNNAFNTSDASVAIRSGSDIGRQTGEKTKLLDSETGMASWLFKAIYYDKFGRVIQTVTDNHLGGLDVITNTYNFAGELIQTRNRHTADAVSTYTDTYFDLNHRGKLMKTRFKINGTGEVLLSGNNYNESGNLTTQYLHSESGGTFLQKNDYTYNIRGWVTQLNDPATFLEGDVFGMKLEYNLASTPLYNGNISKFTWGTPAYPTMMYSYSYDANNRLTAANFTKTGVNANGLDEGFAYDVNGNITRLSRYDYYGVLIDSMKYTYQGNNLSSLYDRQGDVALVVDFPGSPTPKSVNYDQNGNETSEPHRYIAIAYNMLNLPKQISWNGLNRKISYFYTFNSEKLRKTVEDNGTITRVDYCGPFVYETVSGTRSLKYILTPHGKYSNTGGIWGHEYNITDLPITIGMGNVRAVIRKSGSTLAIVQTRHYYSFGMEMSQLNVSQGPNRYQYNGKEIQDDFGLYWYDYGARFYDPMVGRWHSVDPLTEKYAGISPYAYVANNPIKFIDPDGRDIWDVNTRGRVVWKEESENHQLFFVNRKGERGEFITVQDRSILDQLTESRRDYNGSYAISNSIAETFNVFHFMANNTNVEWGIDGYRATNNNEYIVRTSHSDEAVTRSTILNRYNEFNQIFTIHSHPGNETWEGTKGASIADQNSIINSYNRFKQAGMVQSEAWFKKDGQWTVFPKHYVYHKQSKVLFNYTPWESRVFIRKTNKSSDLYRNLGF
ncbi:MAG: RHS repeat-associated core domain-containing protein [Bacteroidota bacterium]